MSKGKLKNADREQQKAAFSKMKQGAVTTTSGRQAQLTPQEQVLLSKAEAMDNRPYQAMNRDQQVKASRLVPLTKEGLEEWDQNKRRTDLQYYDTPTNIELGTTPETQPEPDPEPEKPKGKGKGKGKGGDDKAKGKPPSVERRENEIDEFYKNYPVEHLDYVIDEYDNQEYTIMALLNEAAASSRGLNRERTINVDDLIEMAKLEGLSENRSKEAIKDLKQKGYLKTNGSGKDKTIRVFEGGFAKFMADIKGEYAKEVYGELDEIKPKHKEAVEEIRRSQVECVEQAQENIFSNINDQLKRRGYPPISPYNPKELPKNAKRHFNELERIKNALQSDYKNADKEIMMTGNDQMIKDAKYLLDNYFNVDPSILTNPSIKFVRKPLRMGVAGHQENGVLPEKFENGNKFMPRPSNPLVRPVHSHEIAISTKQFDKDEMTLDNPKYMRTLLHELVHYLRNNDIRRYGVDAVSEGKPFIHNQHGYRPRDLDKEEKETVLEEVIRMGKNVQEGRPSYYGFSKAEALQTFKRDPDDSRGYSRESIYNPAQFDNKILTISSKLKSDTNLSQVAENIKMRGKATVMGNSILKGRQNEWIDSFYRTEKPVKSDNMAFKKTVKYQVYSEEGDVDPQEIAKWIDKQNGNLGDQKVQMWDDGKLKTLLKGD